VTLAPEIRSWLDWGAEVGESIGSLPLPERREPLRAALDQELRRRGVRVEGVGVVDKPAVPVAGGEIRVRVFTPAGSGPHPLFVHFHGGGFVLGTIDSLVNEAKCAYICTEPGAPSSPSNTGSRPSIGFRLRPKTANDYPSVALFGDGYGLDRVEAGVETRLNRLLGHTHGSGALWQWWDPAREWMDEVVGALEHALHGVAADRRQADR